jgi:hypothetical protein
VSIKKEGLSLTLEKGDGTLNYRREFGDESVEKLILAEKGELIINPVEPLNKPKKITPYLLVEFDKSLVVEPKTSKDIFLTFPIELGVFINGGRSLEILDVFSMTRQKFTLYGSPRGGYICKWWETKTYASIPKAMSNQEGIMSLNVMNETNNWTTITKAVFNAYGMKIYYNKDFASIKAKMIITSHVIAETDFINSPIVKKMTKSLELYTVSKLSMTSTKFIMSEGI